LIELKDKPLEANHFIGVLLNTVRELPDGASGVTISAHRRFNRLRIRRW